MQKTLQRVFWGLAILGFAVGLYGLYQRFAFGHQVAAYGSYVPWGLWIAAYITFVGASAGAVAVAAGIFMLRKENYYPVARVAMLVGLVTFVAGMINVWLDLGHPFRAWKLLVSTGTDSIMGWMAWFYTLYGILLLIGLWATRAGSIPTSIQRYSFLVFFFALVFAGAEGALFGVVGARPLWESGLTPILFLIEGALFGLGFVVAGSYLLGVLTSQMSERFGQILLGLLGTLVVLEWAEYSTGLYAAIPAKSQTLQTIVSGEYWWVFWGFHVGLGVVLPALILLFARNKPLSAAVAGALIGAMGIASKINLVVPALAQEELEGLRSAFSGPGLTFAYFPSTTEWLVFIWTASLAVLLFLAGTRVLQFARSTEVA